MTAVVVTHGRDPDLCFYCQKGKRRGGRITCDRCQREFVKRLMRPPTLGTVVDQLL